MQSRARLGKHPMHPMLVMLPIAMFPLLLVLDVLWSVFDDASFWRAGFWVAVVGLVGTLAAMVPGIVDMAAIPEGTKAHRTGLFHAISGSLVLVLYAAAIWARWPAGSDPDGATLAIALDVLGLLLISLQGWLGGELVYRHHVGVMAEREGAEPVVLKGSRVTELPRGAPGDARRRDVGRP